MGWAVGLLALGITALVHELGHAIVVMRCGLRVYEVAVGFGPSIAGCSVRGSRITLRLFPVGGLIRFDGDGFEALSPGAKRLTFLAGPLGSLLWAWLCFAVTYLMMFSDGTIWNRMLESAAYGAGVMWRLLVVSARITAQCVTEPAIVMGPVGVLAMMDRLSPLPFAVWLFVFGVLSGCMGLFNLIPLPPLDGGKALLTGLTEPRAKRMARAVERAGVVLLGVLAVVVILGDVLMIMRT